MTASSLPLNKLWREPPGVNLKCSFSEGFGYLRRARRAGFCWIYLIVSSFKDSKSVEEIVKVRYRFLNKCIPEGPQSS
jgi:hypothetical protein